MTRHFFPVRKVRCLRLPVHLCRDVGEVVDGPGLWNVLHADLVPFIDAADVSVNYHKVAGDAGSLDGPTQRVMERREHLGRTRAKLGRVIREARDGPRLVLSDAMR